MNIPIKSFLFVSLLFLFLSSVSVASADNQTCVGGIGGTCQVACGNGTVENAGFTCSGTDKCCVAAAAAGGATTGGLKYQLLEKIPGTDKISGSDLPGYISAIYKVALIVVTLSAVLMLSIGGFMYLTSAGNTAAMGTAKGIIYDSLIGLVIALSAWLVLYIINPDLVKITLTPLPPLDNSNPPAAAPATGTGTLPPQSSVDLATQILASGNITLAGGGDCSSPSGVVSPRKNIQDVAAGKLMAACYAGTTCAKQGSNGCADNVVRPSETMLKAIWTVGQTMAFEINSISGGPHASNSKHYTGQAIDIDRPINQALMDAFVKAGAIAPNGTAATSMCEKPNKDANGVVIGVSSVNCTNGGANHLHLIFPG